MLNQIISGAVDDPIAAQMLSTFLPVLIRKGAGIGANIATGTGISFLPISNLMGGANPGQAFYSQYQNSIYNNSYRAVFNPLVDNVNRAQVADLFRAFGYSQLAADREARSGWGKALQFGIGFTGAGANFTPLMQEMFARRALFTTVSGAPESYYAQIAGARQIARNIASDVQDGRSGGLNISEMSALTGRLLQTGNYDNFGSGDNTRITRIRRDVRKYAEALGELKQVLQGDIPQIIGQLDQLFGGSALNMSASEFSRVTNSLTRTSLHTGTSAAMLNQMGALGYSLLSPLGGSQMMGATAGQTAAWFTAGGTQNSRLSQQAFIAGATRLAANRFATGEAKYIGAAQYLWAEARGMDPASRAATEAFLGAHGGVVTREDASRILRGFNAESVTAALNSRRAQEIAESNPELLRGAMLGDVSTAARARYDTLLEQARNAGLGEDRARAFARRAQYTGRDGFRAILKEYGLSGASLVRAEARIDRALDTVFSGLAGAQNADVLEAMVNNLPGTRARIQASAQQQAVSDLAKNMTTAGGLAGVFSSLHRMGADSTIASTVAGILGVNSDEFYRLSNLMEKLNGRDLNTMTARDWLNEGVTDDADVAVIKRALDFGKTGVTVLEKGPGIMKAAPGTAANNRQLGAYIAQRSGIMQSFRDGSINMEDWKSYLKNTDMDAVEAEFITGLIESGDVGILRGYGTRKYKSALKDYRKSIDITRELFGSSTTVRQRQIVADLYKKTSDLSVAEKRALRTGNLDGLSEEQLRSVNSITDSMKSAGINDATLFVGAKADVAEITQRIAELLEQLVANGIEFKG